MASDVIVAETGEASIRTRNRLWYPVLAPHKATDADGNSSELLELYPQKWAIILKDVLEMAVHDLTLLSHQLRTAIVIPLYKKEEEDDPENYLAIALLSDIVKVFTSPHKNRLHPILPFVVPPAPTEFVVDLSPRT